MFTKNFIEIRPFIKIFEIFHRHIKSAILNFVTFTWNSTNLSMSLLGFLWIAAECEFGIEISKFGFKRYYFQYNFVFCHSKNQLVYQVRKFSKYISSFMKTFIIGRVRAKKLFYRQIRTKKNINNHYTTQKNEERIIL